MQDQESHSKSIEQLVADFETHLEHGITQQEAGKRLAELGANELSERPRPGFWALVMVLYPLFSAYPQELVYRAFFFHRYRLLFRTPRQMIWASSLAFAFLHIIFQNPIGVILTIPGGYLLSLTYQRTNSLVLTGIEHALYGNLVFTVGLGLYFYRGPF
jgi:membrane protease YdiL (CAAX protease family)